KLKILDLVFTLLHLIIIAFNLFGWILKKTRKAHLIVAGITLASWFILGIWTGWGYCFLTDWHWRVKEKLGETSLPNSFIKYMADKISGQNIDPGIVDVATLGIFLAAIILSLYVNFFTKKTKA